MTQLTKIMGVHSGGKLGFQVPFLSVPPNTVCNRVFMNDQAEPDCYDQRPNALFLLFAFNTTRKKANN